MKALIVILATVALFGCAETGHPPIDTMSDVPVLAGQRTAQQSDAIDCTAAPRHRAPHGLADAATGDAFAMHVSFTYTFGTDGAIAQLDDPTKDWTRLPRHSQGCKPRRAHHYFA